MTRLEHYTANPANRSVAVESYLYVQDCCSCGVVFAVGKKFDARRRDDKQSFYCPNGHAQSYTGPTAAQQAEAARKDAQRLKQQLDWATTARKASDDRADAAERSRAAQKGANTKLRKRVANGVCPCCKRSFKDLQRHMSGQHPDFHAET